MKAGSLEILEKAQLPHDQARAILAAMEFELASHDADLVRKGELHSLETNLHSVEAKLHSVETKLYSVETKLHSLEVKLHSLEVRMERGFGELRGEIKAQGTRYVLWMFSMFVAFSGLILGVLGRGH